LIGASRRRAPARAPASRCRTSRGQSRITGRVIETDAAVRTTIGGLVVPAGWSKAAGAVPEHSADVPSASGARESSRKRCPSDQGHGCDGYRQATRVRLERHQRRERETEKGDRDQDRVRPQHAPPEPLADSLRHALTPIATATTMVCWHEPRSHGAAFGEPLA